MKLIFLHKVNNLTARHDSQSEEVLFFADPHFLFFNFLPTAQVAHLPVRQAGLALPDTQAEPSQNQKSHFPNALLNS